MVQKTFPVKYDQVQVCQVKQIHAKCSAHLYGIHLVNQLTREQCYEIRATHWRLGIYKKKERRKMCQLKCTVDHQQPLTGRGQLTAANTEGQKNCQKFFCQSKLSSRQLKPLSYRPGCLYIKLQVMPVLCEEKIKIWPKKADSRSEQAIFFSSQPKCESLKSHYSQDCNIIICDIFPVPSRLWRIYMADVR